MKLFLSVFLIFSSLFSMCEEVEEGHDRDQSDAQALNKNILKEIRSQEKTIFFLLEI